MKAVFCGRNPPASFSRHCLQLISLVWLPARQADSASPRLASQGGGPSWKLKLAPPAVCGEAAASWRKYFEHLRLENKVGFTPLDVSVEGRGWGLGVGGGALFSPNHTEPLSLLGRPYRLVSTFGFFPFPFFFIWLLIGSL